MESSRTGRLLMTGDAVETGMTDGFPLGDVTDCWLLVATVVSSVPSRCNNCSLLLQQILLFPDELSGNSASVFPCRNQPPVVCACAVLTGTTGLQVDGGGVAGVKERHGRGGGERVDAVQKRLVVQVVESAVRLPRLVRRPEQHRAADEFILNRAGPQTSTLRLDLMNR